MSTQFDQRTAAGRERTSQCQVMATHLDRCLRRRPATSREQPRSARAIFAWRTPSAKIRGMSGRMEFNANGASESIPVPRRLAQPPRQQLMKVIARRLALDAEAPRVKRATAQAALHLFADADVLFLDAVRHGD